MFGLRSFGEPECSPKVSSRSLPGACVKSLETCESQVGRKGLAHKPFPLPSFLLLDSNILTSDALASKGEKDTVVPPFPNRGRNSDPLSCSKDSVRHPPIPPTCCVELPKSMQSTFARVTRLTTIIVQLFV